MDELRRKTLHISSGLLLLGISYIFDGKMTASFYALLVLVTCLSEFLRSFSLSYHCFFQKLFSSLLRDFEETELIGTFTFLLSYLICFLLFPQKIFLLGILGLLFGDSLAAIVGKKFGRIKLYRKKSLEGTLAFAGIVFLLWSLIPSPFSFVSLLIAAIVTAVVELFSPKNLDNLLIPLISGFLLLAASLINYV